jgi:large subunit ribosomal protein L24e
MAVCSFCNKNITRGTGIMYVKNSGKILHFCGSKCEKNLIKLKRRPLNFKWASKQKEVKKVE